MPSSAYASAAGCFPWLDPWPPPAVTDDANPWVTGLCWLYCRRGGVRVLWIGSIHTPGARGDLYGCGSCIAELDHMVRLQVEGGLAEGGGGAVGRAHTGTVTVPPRLDEPPAEREEAPPVVRPAGEKGQLTYGARVSPSGASTAGSVAGAPPRLVEDGNGAEVLGAVASRVASCRHVVCRGGKFCDRCGCQIYL